MSDWSGDPAMGCGLMILAIVALIVVIVLGILVGLGLFAYGVLG